MGGGESAREIASGVLVRNTSENRFLGTVPTLQTVAVSLDQRIVLKEQRAAALFRRTCLSI